jgi:hypothetical protein
MQPMRLETMPLKPMPAIQPNANFRQGSPTNALG